MHDVALVFFDRPVSDMVAEAKPVCLSGGVNMNDTGFVSGWGTKKYRPGGIMFLQRQVTKWFPKPVTLGCILAVLLRVIMCIVIIIHLFIIPDLYSTFTIVQKCFTRYTCT